MTTPSYESRVPRRPACIFRRGGRDALAGGLNSKEYYNGGTPKRELMGSMPNGPDLLNMLGGSHCQGAETAETIAARTEISKVYGPFFYYTREPRILLGRADRVFRQRTQGRPGGPELRQIPMPFDLVDGRAYAARFVLRGDAGVCPRRRGDGQRSRLLLVV